MQQLVMVLHVLACVSIVALVLVQHGKGADMGAAFGAGASATFFGSKGSSSFLLKLTGGLALVFFATSLGLGYMTSQHAKRADEVLIPLTTTQEQESIPSLPTK